MKNWIKHMLDPLAHDLGEGKKMRKSAKMTARISLAFAGLSILLLSLTILSFGISPSTPLIIGITLIFIVLFVTNGYGFVNSCSFLMSTLPSVLLMGITVVLKKQMPGNDLHYVDSRIMLVAFSIVPGLIYSKREPFQMYGAILINFFCLALYDPIHEAAGVGYYQQGFSNPTYYHINTISLVVSAAIVAGVLMLKNVVVMQEEKNEELLILKDAQNSELEAQNEEIFSQTEQLSAAYETIERQKQQLERHAEHLQGLISVKNDDLGKSNEELQKYNTELRQFSYTVSHNLRGPVARLLGLNSLVDMSDKNLSADNRKIIELIGRSSLELDQIIKELSRIIDIRNDLYTIRKKVFFEDEWNQIYHSLETQITPDMQLNTDFTEAPFIYVIRPFLNSIIYNLVSNAIRYRSPQRPLKVSLKTFLKDNKITIEVADNGLGINLELFGDNVFGMYKRFHTHVAGRGLGLYLVKTQVEALNGEIDVISDLNKGSTFSVTIKVPTDIEGQICFENEFGSIVYNARINTLALSWKRDIPSKAYRVVLTKCLEIFHAYGTEYWIADLRKQASVSAEDRTWFAQSILNEASKHGLRTIACVYDAGSQESDQSELIRIASRFNIEMQFFLTRSDAEGWIEEHQRRAENSRATVNVHRSAPAGN